MIFLLDKSGNFIEITPLEYAIVVCAQEVAIQEITRAVVSANATWGSRCFSPFLNAGREAEKGGVNLRPRRAAGRV